MNKSLTLSEKRRKRTAISTRNLNFSKSVDIQKNVYYTSLELYEVSEVNALMQLLKDAKILEDGVFIPKDVLIKKGHIADVSPSIQPTADSVVIQLNNCYIVPGFLDVHVHLREPGFSYKETIATGTKAGARGGYTGLYTMPNLNPAPDSLEHLALQQRLIDDNAVVGVKPYACISVGEKGGALTDIEALAPHVAGFSDDGKGVQDTGLMREAMARVRAAGSIIAQHCEDETLLNGGYIHDGDYARAHGHRGISSASEWRMIERDLKLAADTKCRYHVCHVSTKESVALIRDAKKSGVAVTCETAPHYLVLCDEDIREEGRFKMNPPLRGRADRDAMLAGLLDGTVDVIATDHAPHSAEEKSRGLRDSAMGIVGLETAFRVLHTELVLNGVLSLAQLIEKKALRPRAIFGVAGGLAVGQSADLCVIDPAVESVIDPDRFLSMGRATPFAGMRTTGDVVMTLYQGNTVWRQER